MSIASSLICLVFLGFFLCVMPLSIYLFAKRFPSKYPSFIGFPEDPGKPRDTQKIGRADDPSAD
jgi:hypothetical protein